MENTKGGHSREGLTKTRYRRSLLASDASLQKGDGFRQPTPEQVQDLFRLAGWTQTEAAQKLGVDVSTIRRWHTRKAAKEHVPIPYAAWRLALILSGLVDARRQESGANDD